MSLTSISTALPGSSVISTVRSRRQITASRVLVFLVVLLALPHVLLWSFLGHIQPWLAAFAVLLLIAFCFAANGAIADNRDFTVSWQLVGACFAISLLLFVLGGQGHFFYATSDWQVRDAILHDLVTNSWPFTYSGGGHDYVLRAPLAFYLLPSLAGKALGLRYAELAMLIQSSTIMTCILSLGAGLFDGRRKRLYALMVFLSFSGMDVLGTYLSGGRLDRHLEWWSVVQYSSTITLAYWVPMHAFVGWLGAVLYLLWRAERISLAAFLLPLPLLALWSPLALAGVIPFAAAAGLSTLRPLSLRPIDLVVPLCTFVVALPSLFYLSAGTEGIPPGFNPIDLQKWTAFECLEVVPFLLAAASAEGSRRFGPVTVLITSIMLMVLPLGQLGSGPDVPMRVSIASLTVLSVLVADLIASQSTASHLRSWRKFALVALLIGSVTPITETWRAIARPRPEERSCSYFDVVPNGAPTYVAPVDRLPIWVAPRSAVAVQSIYPPSCRELDWRQTEERYTGA